MASLVNDSSMKGEQGRDSDFDFARIEDALEDMRAGRFVVVLDDYDRENEGDLILACEKATAESLAFMVSTNSGVHSRTQAPTKCQRASKQHPMLSCKETAKKIL